LTPDDRIAQLEAAKSELVRNKNEIERKLGEVIARRAKKDGGPAPADNGTEGTTEQGGQKMLSEGWNRRK
jgi:hypothetical protein